VGCDVKHLPACSAKVKNDWSYPSAPPICLPGMDKGKLYFLPLLTFCIMNVVFENNIQRWVHVAVRDKGSPEI
jgi:hypothetical protein